MANSGGRRRLPQKVACLAKQKKTELSDIFYRYRAGFNHIAAIAIVSSRGYVLEINEKFTSLYGYARSEVVGRPISIIRSPATPRSVHASMWQAVIAGQLWSSELQNCRKDGQLIHVRAIIAPAESGDGALLVTYQDISAEVAGRKILAAHQREEMKQGLIADTLHNIGNLQHSVVTASTSLVRDSASLLKACEMGKQQLAKEGCADKRLMMAERIIDLLYLQIDKFAQVAARGNKTVLRINDVLDSFRSTQRNIRVIDSVTPSAVLRDALDTYLSRAKDIGISLSVKEIAPEVAEMEVQWPMGQLSQIIQNLMKNAGEAIQHHKATKAPDLRGLIELGVTLEEDYVAISITDNGGGFNVDKQDLFRHGFSTKEKGLGLGLHNAARLVQSMGGHLHPSVTGEEGVNRGSIFKIYLPKRVSEKMETDWSRSAENVDEQRRSSMPNLTRIERTEKLIRVCRSIPSITDYEEVLNLIVSSAHELTNADGVTIYQLNSDGTALQFSVTRNISMFTTFARKTHLHPAFADIPLQDDGGNPYTKSVAAYVANNMETVVIDNVNNDHRFDFSTLRRIDDATGYETKSILTMPIVSKNKLVGVLQLINAVDRMSGRICPFVPEDLDMLQVLTLHASEALIQKEGESAERRDVVAEQKVQPEKLSGLDAPQVGQ